MYSDDKKLLIEHCEKILYDRRIQNKIVVLCEGQGSILESGNRKTVVNYSRMEQLPDANFYKRCLPTSWIKNKPEFFNCKSQANVIKTYFALLELHEEDSQKPLEKRKSYLSPDLLFPIVDLDLQPQKLNNYPFQDTEAIFYDIYKQAQINELISNNHRIWVTGLIHKESYFIIPELQELFDTHIYQ